MCYIRFTFCKSTMAPRVGEPNGLKGPLLIGVKLKVEKGQRVLVLGPNGAGKTTALKVPSGTPPPPTGPLRPRGVVLQRWQDRVWG